MTDETSQFGCGRLKARWPSMRKGGLPIVTTAIVATLTGALLATPASGTLSSTVLARAAFVDRVDLKLRVNHKHREVIHVPAAQDTLIQQVVLAPGGQSGWHSHPGPAIVLVKSGELTLYDADSGSCVAHTYAAGQAFIDPGQGHAHLAKNLSTTSNTEMWLTYFDVPPGASQRIDMPNPGTCPF